MKTVFAVAVLVTSIVAGSICPRVSQAAMTPPRDADRSWVTLNIFDSFYPFTTDQTFPDVLGSIEVIYELFTGRLMGRDLRRVLGGLKNGDAQGDRSREGHFTIWVHFSDHFLKEHPLDRQAMGNQIFMFPDRNNDIFTGWGGSVNLAALLSQGVEGFGIPIRDPQTGKLNGSFQNFVSDIAPLGDADYEGGWYMNDDQAARIATVFTNYGGLQYGYSFMSFTSDRPNAPYEPAGAQLDNGYNCGDFAFYALTTAGVVSRDEVEALKVKFWYPKYYFDHPMPLAGTGAAGEKWLKQNPGQTSIPGSEMISIGWEELLFGPLGLQFWDKRQIATDIVDQQYEIIPARVWDQAHPIAWLKEREDFPSKGIWTELLPAVLSGAKITSPVRTVQPNSRNRFILSRNYRNFQKQGRVLEDHKLVQARISGFAGDEFQKIFESLKHPLP